MTIRCAECLGEAAITPFVGSVGESFGNALAEIIFGLFKTAIIRQQGPWKHVEDVECTPLNGVD